VYGPQKGADAPTVEELDRALKRFGRVVGIDDLPGAGAAGGTGAGLVAFLGAALEPGAPLIVGATGFGQHLPGTDVVFTGEGRADGQTAYGKAPGEVARRAAAAGVPVVLLAGSKGPGWEALHGLGVGAVVTMTDGFRDPEGSLSRAAVVACRSRKWER
jgi:glycerate kinase